MSKLYKTCPRCGSNIDFGEICDCMDIDAHETAPESGEGAGQQATANPHEPVLVPRA